MSYSIDTSYLRYNGRSIADYTDGQLKTYAGYAAAWSKDSIYCDFFKDGKYLRSLRRNNYRSSIMLVEFFEIDGLVVFIFNLAHGEIAVVDAESGRTLHTDANDDKFIYSYTISGDYMILYGWWWNPIDFLARYRISKFLRTPNYNSEVLDSSIEDLNLSVNDSKIICERTNDCLTFEEASTSRISEIHAKIKQMDINELFNSDDDSLLNVIYNSLSVVFVGDAKARLKQILDGDTITICCKGAISGLHIQDYEDLIVTPIAYSTSRKIIGGYRETITKNDSLYYLVPKVLLGTFIRMIPVEQLALNFTITGNDTSIEIKIREAFIPDDTPGANSTRYMVDPNGRCDITVV